MFWGANDMPQGEFWHEPESDNVPTRSWEMLQGGTRVWRSNVRRAAMAAHIYGRSLVAAEAFTNMNPHFREYPAVLKPEIDAAFVDGLNQVVWHTFSASPAEFGKPGIMYFAGAHVNPNVTWWDDAGAFFSYLGRAQALLRHGQFVADACVYTSDQNYLRWGRDKAWSDKATLSLPEGYTYDLINTEVLLNRLTVRGEYLVLPDGMQYRTLVLDLEDNIMPAEALVKIAELAKSGAVVVLGQRRPARGPGLQLHVDRDAEIRRLTQELWGDSGGENVRRFGKGRLMRGITLEEALKRQGVVRDFEGSFEYIHRHAADADIYFLSGSGRADCTFRVSGKEPELWDAVTGATRDALLWRSTGDGRTVVPISLPENGSVFVVFRRPASKQHLVSAPSGDGVEIEGRTADGARIRAWGPGRHEFGSAAKSRINVEVADLPAPVTLDGPWRVRFAPGGGAPASATFDRLTPWNEHPHDGIRYFSGTATYHGTFQFDASQAKRLVRLRLGEVKDIARVRVNGKLLGIVWTAPWTVDLTNVVKPGRNELEIDVTNTWVNRLVGDAALPADQRITNTILRRSPDYKGQYPHLRGYLATDPLLRSGLLGPVRLEFGEEREIRF